MHKNKSGKMVIVDEGVSDSQLTRFKRFTEDSGLIIIDYQLVRLLHPGMPDGQILLHLLNGATIFITTDRPLHNTVLSKGLASFYLDGQTITRLPLPGIKLKVEGAINKKDQSIKTTYLPPTTEIRALLLPDSLKRLEKLRTKRRRIRNYFGGLDHLEQIAVTVSWRPLGLQILIGVRIHVSSNVGMKALDESESYTAETLPSDCWGLGSMAYALVLVIQLILNSVKTVVYYDSAFPLLPTTPDGSYYGDFLKRLSESFEHLEFVPVQKGRHLESLRKKLIQLMDSSTTNEIQQENLLAIRNRSRLSEGTSPILEL
jgi:hypothetical protein